MAPNATKETAHHLYRSLLRTVSYLPTSETRQWVGNRITSRFRRKSEMTNEHFKDAKQLLRQLDRATHGDMSALTKVFNYTYGRAGPRRRQLLSSVIELLHKSDLANPPIHPPLLPTPEPRKARLSPDHNRGGSLTLPTKEPAPCLTAYQRFLLDQDVHKPKNVLGRNAIRFIDPPIPQRSIWERSPAVKLERGIVGRWVEESLDNVVPPLPMDEWQYLKDVALGVVAPETPPKRRTRVGNCEENSSLLTLENLKFSIRHTQQNVLRNRKNSFSHHTLTPKFLQRLYVTLWYASAKMEWNEEMKRWVYTWGNKEVEKKREFRPVPRDSQLFDGLEDFSKVARKLHGVVKKSWHEKRMGKKAKTQESVGEVDGVLGGGDMVSGW